MKKMRNYFHIIMTAVICFFMSLKPGRRKNKGIINQTDPRKKACSQTQAVPGCSDTAGTAYENYSMVNGSYTKNFSSNRFKHFMKLFMKKKFCWLKKKFYWLTGPGDRVLSG